MNAKAHSEIRVLAQHLLHVGLAPLPEREARLIAHAARRMHTARNLNQVFDARLAMGARLADKVAAIGGSWRFIIGFALFLAAWALINTVVLIQHAFDPYPYIFLNLLLSMLAAIQAPIIMMSQNRQAEKDRFMAAKDYEINLKAEIEVLGLHHKIDLQVLKEIKDLRDQLDSLCE